MKREEKRAAAGLRKLYAEAEKLEAEARRPAPEAGSLRAMLGKFRHSAIADFAKLGLAMFAAILVALEFVDSVGRL